MEINEITVFLKEDQAKNFIAFQENYDNFVILVEHKVFKQKGAAITLNFDKYGVIRSINRQDNLYDHRTGFINQN